MFAYLLADFISALFSLRASPLYYILVAICYCVYMRVFGTNTSAGTYSAFWSISPLGKRALAHFLERGSAFRPSGLLAMSVGEPNTQRLIANFI